MVQSYREMSPAMFRIIWANLFLILKIKPCN